MSIASSIKAIIEQECPSCFSLYAGYGMHGGSYVHFPTGVQEMETRNKKGQCSSARYRYADGSTLTYKRLQDNQYTLTAKELNHEVQ